MRATLALLPLAAALSGCISVTANDVSATPPRAAPGAFGEASLINASGTRIGRAVLTQGATGLLIRIEADGLTPGWHGVHIHATGQCAAPFTSAGAHVNHGDPQAPHGLLNAGGPDDGDLPKIFADAGELPVHPKARLRDPTMIPDGQNFKGTFLSPEKLASDLVVWSRIFDEYFR